MQWIPTAFRFWSNRSIASRKSITQWAFAFALFSVSLFPFSFARGDDFNVNEESIPPLQIEDLTPEARVAVSNLAISLSAANANANVATVDDNVAAILALLQGISFSWAIKTYPYANQNSSLWQLISRNINEYPNVVPSGQSTSSYFYEIQRAIYGQAGVPSSKDAIQPILLRIEDLISTNSYSSGFVDLSFTNSVLQYLDDIAHSIDSSLASIEEDVGQSTGYLGYLSSLFDSEFYEQHAYQATAEDSALRVVDANVLSALFQINQSLSGIGSELDGLSSLVGSGFGSTSSVSNQLADLLASVSSIEDYTRQIHYDDLEYSETDRSVQRDFRFLHQQLGVEEPSRTNNIYYLLSRLFDDSPALSVVSATGSVIESEINAAKESAESSFASASNTVVRIAEEDEPDWEHDRYTGDNPLDTGDSIFDLPLRQATSLLPTLPESQHKEIVIFRGDFPIMGGVPSQSRSRRSVRLDVAYPLADYDEVSSGMVSLRTIMEWVWQLCSAVLCVSMLFRFYTSLATDKLNMEADAAMGV